MWYEITSRFSDNRDCYGCAAYIHNGRKYYMEVKGY